MDITPHMSLNEWDLLTDPYEKDQLVDNWNKLDTHDHSPGKGVQIPAGGLAPHAVVASNLDPSVAVINTGMIMLWPSAILPVTYLLCDGSTYPTATYPNLFNVVGYTFGGSGATFAVPFISWGPPPPNLNWIIKT